MANKKTRALDKQQYQAIITTIKGGYKTAEGKNMRPNEAIATALTLEANLGMRIGDILALRLSDVIHEGGRYHLDVVEDKTEKKRTFTVLPEIYAYMQDYCLRHDIGKSELMFPKTEGAYHRAGTPENPSEHLTERTVQKILAKACEHLGMEGISTHSFRKFFATEIYNNNGCDIELVRTLLQHSSTTTTQRYIGISSKKVEEALAGHLNLV